MQNASANVLSAQRFATQTVLNAAGQGLAQAPRAPGLASEGHSFEPINQRVNTEFNRSYALQPLGLEEPGAADPAGETDPLRAGI